MDIRNAFRFALAALVMGAVFAGVSYADGHGATPSTDEEAPPVETAPPADGDAEGEGSQEAEEEAQD